MLRSLSHGFLFNSSISLTWKFNDDFSYVKIPLNGQQRLTPLNKIEGNRSRFFWF